jgi:hypothetical protein
MSVSCSISALGYFEIDGIKWDDGPVIWEVDKSNSGTRIVLQRTLDQGTIKSIMRRVQDSPDTHTYERRSWYQKWQFQFEGSTQAFRDHLATLHSLQKPFTVRYNDVMSRVDCALHDADGNRTVWLTPTYPIRPRGWEIGDDQDWSCAIVIDDDVYQAGEYTVYPEAGVVVFDTALDVGQTPYMTYEWFATCILDDNLTIEPQSTDFFDIRGMLVQVESDDVLIGYVSDNSECPNCVDNDGDGDGYQDGSKVALFYFANNVAAPVAPTVSTDWESTSSNFVRRKLLTPDEVGPDANGIVVFDTGTCDWPGSEGDMLSMQFVSSPLKAQTINGTVSSFMQYYDGIGFSGGCAGVLRVAIMVRLFDNAGATEKAVLFAMNVGATNISQSAYTNRQLALSDALTPAAAADGDRLVVEVGWHRVDTWSPGMRCDPMCGPLVGVALHHGSKDSLGGTTRLPANETDTSADKAPWIGFGAGILMQ